MKDFVFDSERYEILLKIIEHQEKEIEVLKEIIDEYKKMAKAFDRAVRPSMN